MSIRRFGIEPANPIIHMAQGEKRKASHFHFFQLSSYVLSFHAPAISFRTKDTVSIAIMYMCISSDTS